MHRIRSRFGLSCFESPDLGAKILDRSFVRLALTGGGVVTGTLVEQAEEADGIHGTEVIGEDGDTLAVEVDGIGVIRGGAHGISDGGELDGIDDADGQVVGMSGREAEELLVRGEQGIRFQTLGGGEVECVEALETETVQMDAPLFDVMREELE